MTDAKRMLRRSTRVLAVAAAVMAAPCPAAAQSPATRAERTGWMETSRYADVMDFLDRVVSVDDAGVLHPTTFGYSLEGRPLPLVVVGTGLGDATPESVRATGRLRVLVLANIHGGEVEGKEAAQLFLRDVARGAHEGWLDSLVVLVAPIYNADGNERVSVLNRSRQNGPLGGVGERANAQGLDLNRDHMKLESPEARSLVGLLQAYDPQVVVDLHTTNGTRHGYHLTYSPPLHPDTDSGILALLRSRWLPEASRRLESRLGWYSYYYGNAYAPEGGERGWYTFDYRPRFNNNYVGLRNRVAILSEAYSYASFEERTRATLAFVEAVLEYAAGHATAVADVVAAADAAELREDSLPLRARFQRGPEVEILMGAAEARLSPYSGREYLARTGVVQPERMPEYGTFAGMERERVPAAYYLPPGLAAVADLLRFHGARLEPVPEERVERVERFVIDSTRVAERVFQGHREREVWGRWETTRLPIAAGSVEVPMDQPLARLVFHLLEPRAPDGVVAWNLVDDAMRDSPGHYPVLRRVTDRR